MTSTQTDATSPLVTSSDRPSLIGRVKWFNNKTGYGFITVTDGDRVGSDIFVHHSSIMVSSEQYKYLVQGEYVQFKLDNTATGTHVIQAGEVSGINGGKLMCETRRDFRQTRTSYKDDSKPEDVSDEEPVKMPRSTRAPKARGSGPRENASPTSVSAAPSPPAEWTLVKGRETGDTTRPGRGGASNRGATIVGGRGRGRPPRAPTTNTQA
uniref:CSD domain-containing protein n=1 Tax=viral metagenome TaxID=1070528 RepID=A0A6C0HXF5_9ZZZZ